jgi:ABC-type lipoprotein export system ATPase subunit
VSFLSFIIMRNIFEIENLRCSYHNSDKVVLQIDKLVIPEKKIVAILGLSGVGKSTLLESLGLMNNTLRVSPDTKFNFYPEENTTLLLHDIWKRKDKEISYIRNRYFSFIFQDTNLMPNFSIYENICLTLMLQGNSRRESEIITNEYLEKIGLGEVEKDQKVFELSGGQRQRVAFIRAIAPDFKVIFGDEPTGNLDKITSRILMQLLNKSIKDKERTAILVSHDVELCLDFSDQIVVINRHIQDHNGKSHSFGVINEDMVFFKDDDKSGKWASSVTGTIENNELFEYIKSVLTDSKLVQQDKN